MADKDPGVWAIWLQWISSHRADWSYAGIAGMSSLLRSAYAKSAWTKRMLDALSCSALAFYVAPTLQVTGALFNWNIHPEAAKVAAFYIGYMGNDYISEKIRGWINRRSGDKDED